MDIRTRAESARRTREEERELAIAASVAKKRAQGDHWLQQNFEGLTLAELEREGFKVQFLFEQGYSLSLQIEIECNECGHWTWSRSIFDWADLGEVLQYPTPDYSHKCYGRPAPQTPADKLLEALNEYIKEAMPAYDY